MLKKKFLLFSSACVLAMTMLQAEPLKGIAESVSSETEEVTTDILGDVNGDGTVSVIDVVLLQKWLLGKGELACGQNADLTGDGVVNVFDLCLVKKKLINDMEAEVYPVANPVVIDEFTPCTATIEDNFENWLVFVTIKHQYSVPERIWSVEDFDGVENIKSILQYKELSPYRQILEISLKNPSKENVLKMIHDIEALNLTEIKEVCTYLYPYF